jgi:hypothetical protein
MMRWIKACKLLVPVRQLRWAPSWAPGTAPSTRAKARIHSICPVTSFPNIPKIAARKTMPRLVPIARRVGIPQQVNHDREEDNPRRSLLTISASSPTSTAARTAVGRLNRTWSTKAEPFSSSALSGGASAIPIPVAIVASAAKRINSNLLEMKSDKKAPPKAPTAIPPPI